MREKTPERQKQLRERRRAYVFTALATVAGLSAQNWELIRDGVVLFQDNHEVPVPDGCEVKDPRFRPAKVPEEEKDPILLAVGGGQSAARSVPLTPSGSFEARDLHVGFFDNKIGEYYQPASGITYAVRSDRDSGFEINKADLEQATSVAFMDPEIYQHPAVRQVMECMHRDIFEERKLEGQTIDLFIPSRPDVCMSGLFMMQLNATQTSDACHTTGFTMPPFNVYFGPLTYEEDGYMVVTGGNNDPEFAERRIARLTVHESVHQYLRMLNVDQRMDPEERFVDYIVMSAEEQGLYQNLRPVSYLYDS